MNTEIQDIFNVLRKNLSDLKSQYDIHTIEVFGSYIREEHSSASDLDLLVSFNEDMTSKRQYFDYLNDILDSITIDLPKLKPLIQKVVQKSIKD